jgi:hypothetical protein
MDFLTPVKLLAAEVKAPDPTSASCGCDISAAWKEKPWDGRGTARIKPGTSHYIRGCPVVFL